MFSKDVNKRLRVIKIALLISLAFLIGGCSSGEVTLNIIHVNDTHSHIEPDNDGNYGYARIKTVVDSIRSETGEYTLFIHGGDMFPGTLYYNIYRGKSDIKSFNMMGLDVYVLGNHEFDNGPEYLGSLLNLSDAEVVSANITSVQGNLEPLVKPYVIKQFGNVKVGIIGLITTLTKQISSSEEIKFLEYLPVIQENVKKLKEQECNYVILAVHIGTRSCLDLIKEMSGVNMVIDGHSHTLLDTTVYDSENKAVRYRQARHHSQYVGIAELKFDNAGNVKPDGEAYDILELNSSIKEDPVFLDSLGIWSKPVQDYDAIIAGYISDDLLLHNPASRSGEFALGNLIADAFLWYGQKHNAQAAIINTGGVREDLNAPDVTMKDIYSVLPFGNTLDIVTVTGRELLDMMSNGVSRVGGSGSGRFPQVSGIRFAYDKSEGEIKWVKIKQGSRFVNVNPKNRYKIAVNSYMTTGGDGYVMLQELSPSDQLTGLAPQQQVLADYLNYKSTAENPLNIAEIEDNRIKAYE